MSLHTGPPRSTAMQHGITEMRPRRRARHSELPPLYTRFAMPVRPPALPPAAILVEYYAPRRLPAAPPRPLPAGWSSSFPPLRSDRPLPRWRHADLPPPGFYLLPNGENPYNQASRPTFVPTIPPPPAVWVREDYVPFGSHNAPAPFRAATPSPGPVALERMPSARSRSSRSESARSSPADELVEEIAAMVQAEIDEIEQELLARGETVPPRAGRRLEVEAESHSAVSAKLLAPFAHAFVYVEGDEPDERKTDNPSSADNTPSTTSSASNDSARSRESFFARRDSSDTFADCTRPPSVASLADIDGQETKAVGPDGQRAGGTRVATEALYAEEPLVASPVPATGEGRTGYRRYMEKIPPPLSAAPAALVTPPTPADDNLTFLLPATPTTVDEADATPEDNHLRLFSLVRQTLTINEKLWPELDEANGGGGDVGDGCSTVASTTTDARRASSIRRVPTIRRKRKDL